LILARVYFSLEDAKWPALLEIAAFAVYLITVFALRHSSLQHGCIALGFALARTSKALVLFVGLARKLGTLQMRENVLFLTKITVSALLMAGLIQLTANLLGHHLDTSRKVDQLLLVAVPALVGLVVYLVAILALRVREISALVDMGRKRRGVR